MSCRTTWLPTDPLPPVTSTVIAVLTLFRVEQFACHTGLSAVQRITDYAVSGNAA
jgi:hypothetical protein